MFFNDGSVSEDICLHLSLEKVYVTELNTSLALFQVGPLHNEIIMLLMTFTQWCSFLILMEIPCLLRADDKNGTHFNIRNRLERKYEDLQTIFSSVEDFTNLYAPDDKRLEGLESMTGYLMDECDETSIQTDDGTECLNAVISVVQHMPDFDANSLSCDGDYRNCSQVFGNKTKEQIENFRSEFLNGVGKCNYSISRSERNSLEVRCTKEQNTGTPTQSHGVNVNEECPPDTLFWQGLENWSSNLTSMLKRLKADSHEELGRTCKERIILDKEKKKRKRERKKKKKNQEKEKRRNRRKKAKKKARRLRKKEKIKAARELKRATKDARRLKRIQKKSKKTNTNSNL